MTTDQERKGTARPSNVAATDDAANAKPTETPRLCGLPSMGFLDEMTLAPEHPITTEVSK